MRRRWVLGAGVLVAGATAASGAVALTGGSEPVDGAPGQLRIATGPPGAVYRKLGGALATVLAQRLPKTRVSTIPTGASVDNLALLDRGGTELALASMDAIVAGLASSQPRDVTAVARVYDSWLHLFVRSTSPVTRVADLDGRSVAAGAEGSGTRFTVTRLLALVGVHPKLVTANQDEGATMLANGDVDAYFTLTGIPTPAVTQQLLPRAAVRLIDLGVHVEDMNQRYGQDKVLYGLATLPASTYPGVKATPTLTTPNLLLARPDLSTSLVRFVAETLFGQRARIIHEYPEANRINVRTGIGTSPIRLHPGAVAYFRSMKL
jgi:TRAP transporter TAXI family solute receptor